MIRRMIAWVVINKVRIWIKKNKKDEGLNEK